jgi:hypothetical protein
VKVAFVDKLTAIYDFLVEEQQLSSANLVHGGLKRDQADAASAEVGVSIGISAAIVVPVEVDINSSLPPS